MVKRVRISKIDNKMNEIGVELSVLKSLAKILADLEMHGGCEDIKQSDITGLAIIILREIKYIDEKYNAVLRILGI